MIYKLLDIKYKLSMKKRSEKDLPYLAKRCPISCRRISCIFEEDAGDLKKT